MAELLRARYGAAAPANTVPGNDVIRALVSHRSVRAFDADRALPAGTIETLVAAAQSASTSSNLQTWSVVAVEDAGRRARLSEFASKQAFIRQAPLFMCWLADLSRLDRLGTAKGRKFEALDYLETFMVAIIDAALAAQNAAVAAESLGLGCVYVGALRNKPEAVAAELGLPPHVMAVFGLSIGYPDPARPAEIKPRLPQSLILHREQYATKDEPAAIAAYDGEMKRFSARNGMGDTDWTSRVVSRVGTAAGMSGRDRMRAILNALGFELR
ncbi:MAG: nitroreductase family protein [Alphaproteobacteria bacterium]|nr:nitroreductase family protein [Alphaproteobacteria bacterium]